MMRIMAIWTKAKWVRMRCSTSLARRRQRLSQPKVRSTIQRFGRTTKPLAVSDRLTIGNGALQEREQPADLLQYGQAAVPVLDVGRKDGHPQHQAERIHDRMALAPLDLLAGIVTDRIRGFAPLSALLTLWLSTIAVVGLASLPACSRART